MYNDKARVVCQPDKRLQVGCGVVSTRSFILFHNWLLREDLLLRVGGADYLHMNDTGRVLANSQHRLGTGRAI